MREVLYKAVKYFHVDYANYVLDINPAIEACHKTGKYSIDLKYLYVQWNVQKLHISVVLGRDTKIKVHYACSSKLFRWKMDNIFR